MFNPTFIPLVEEFTFEDSNKDNDNGNPRAVFLYYDPLGDRSACNKVPANLGLPAFLNFAFCHLTSLDGDQQSKDLQSFFPFGNVDQHTNVFAGSARFPLLRAFDSSHRRVGESAWRTAEEVLGTVEERRYP